MSPDAILEQDFGLIADLVHGYALERPQHPALIHDERVLTYGELDRLMDRVAASLQRDGVESGDVISICAASCVEYGAIFLGALRAGVAVAPLAPSSTPEALATMLADCGAKILFLDEPIAAALDGQALPASLRRVPISMRDWLAPEDAQPRPVQIEPGAPFNIIYSSGTTGTPKGIVQSHRMRWAHVHRAALARYDRDGSHDLLDAAVFEHDAGELLSDAGARRHRRADGEVRRAEISGAGAAASRDARDARAGAVPAHHGSAGVRSLRPAELPHEVLHQRAVRGGAQGGHPRSAGRAA